MKISDYPDLISEDESSFLIAADWLEEQGRDYEAWCLRQGYVFSVWLFFFSINLNRVFGTGYSYGYSVGYDYGDGAGYGDGDGDGFGDGDGTGYGDGDGDGDGDGFGYGNGYGEEDSYGGFGDGTGYQNSNTNTLLGFFTIIFRNSM
jgi:hypothetical protein